MRSSLAATLVALGATLAVVESVLAAPSLPCDVGLFKTTDGTCTFSCPSSSFGDAKTGTCKSCYSTSYKSCTSARVGAATACVQGYYLKAGRCMAEANIPAGSYGTADGKVVNCGDGVQKCSAAGIESCKANYTLSNGKCIACPTGSSACSSPTIATACNTGYFLSNGQCIKTCPASTFANTATAKCQPCFAPSYTSCTNARSSSATACATGYYLTGGRCMPASAIPKGKYGGSDGKLHLCPTGQATCTEAGPTTCKTGYTLSADKTKCEEKPACAAHSVCDAAGTVTSCTDSYRLLNGACAPPCAEGTYPYWRDGSCKATCPTDSWLLNGACAQCDPHAVSCGLWQYMQCEPGWTRVGFDYEQTCWKKCPDGQRPTDRSENAVCVPCSDPNAENCFADDSSLYCKPGFLVSYDRAQKFRRCVDKCGDQQYNSGAGSSGTCLYCPDLNASSCEGRSGYPTKCKDGYRVSGDGHSCIVDDQTCISAGQCDASGKLIACGQDWYLLGNECLRSCPLDKVTNHPFNSDTLLGGECIDKCPVDKYQGPNRDNVPGEYCYECGDNVAECGSNGYPSVCKEGYTLWTRSYGATACAYTCPAGTKAQYGTETCVPCSDPGAATCSNYDEALSCIPGYTLVDTTCQAN